MGFKTRESSPTKWWALTGVCLGVTMYTLDSSIVNIAVPSFLKVFKTDLVTVQWVIIGYLLVITSALLAVANLANQIGQKRIFLAGLGIFSFSSLLCGLAPNIEWLIAFRVLQGFGAVGMAALMSSIVVRIFAKEQLGQALGLVTAAATIGTSIGPSVGGLLITWFDWRAIFLVNIPIGLTAIAIIWQTLPPDPPITNNNAWVFDWTGFVLITVSLTSLLIMMINSMEANFDHRLLVALGCLCLLSFLSFLYVESRLTFPLLDLAIFKSPTFSIGLLGRFTSMAINAGYLFIIPFLLEQVLNYSTSKAGLFLTTTPVIVGLTAPWFGKLSDKFGASRFNIAGLICMALGLALMTTFSVTMTEWGFLGRVWIWGLGLGLFNAPNNAIIMKSVSTQQSSLASALLSLSVMFGQVIGVSFLGTLFRTFSLRASQSPQIHNLIELHPTAIATGITQTFLLAIIPVVIMIILNLVWSTKFSSPSS